MSIVRLCRYEVAQKGSCRRGDSCYFGHDLSGRSQDSTTSTYSACSSSTSVPRPSTSRAQVSNEAQRYDGDNLRDRRNLIACVFFKKGNCAKGKACLFSHANVTDESCETPNLCHHHDNAALAVEVPKILVRLIGGASVYFGPQVAPYKIRLPQDLSTVSISGLSLDVTQEDVLKLLRHVYEEIEAEVKLTRSRSATTALVTAEDPSFASNICELLNPSVTGAINHKKIVVTKVPQKADFGPSTQRVNYRTVLCSWPKPTKSVKLCYYDGHLARQVRNHFRDGTYRLLGRIIHSEVLVLKPFESDHGLRELKQYHVHLREVPNSIDDEEIDAYLSINGEDPFTSPVSEPSYDLIKAIDEIKSQMSTVGSVEKFAFVERTLGKSYKAVITFRDENDAVEAYRNLNGMTESNNMPALHIEPIYSVKTKFSTAVYDAIRDRIHNVVEGDPEVHCAFFRNNDASQRLTTIKITSSDMEKVSKTKVDLDMLLQGSIASVDGRTVWHQSLAFKTHSDEVSTIERVNKVAVIIDTASSSLRLFGSDAACESATIDLASLAESLSTASHEISIDDVAFSQLVKSGLTALDSRFGEDKVSLKVTTSSKKLLIHSKIETSAVRNAVAELGITIPLEDVEDCSICLTPAERPIVTRCGHVYCADCFENMCVAEATNQDVCYIACQGQQGGCEIDFTQEELQQNLSSQAFENILKLSFQYYVRNRPLQFKFCPTKDCGQLYRPASAQQPDLVHYCLKCLNGICLSCHACHGRMKCAEWQYIARGEAEAARKMMEKLGVKDCPKCQMHIEKADGCNHMQCESCKVHICWICLKTFENGDKTYRHLNDTHGGIGLQDEYGNELVYEESDDDSDDDEDDVDDNDSDQSSWPDTDPDDGRIL